MTDPKSPGQQDPAVRLVPTADYRDGYSNSVQVRMSVWDFHLVFGTMHQPSKDEVDIRNFQGIYLSPQQAKALWNLLGHNLAQYEHTFGVLGIEPLPQISSQPNGPVN